MCCHTNTVAQSPSPQVDAKALASATVSLLIQGEDFEKQACMVLETAQTFKAGTCATAMQVVDGSLQLAQSVVNTWTDAAANKFGCALGDGINGLLNMETLLTQQGVVIPQIVTDGLNLAQAFLPLCAPDAG